MIQHMPVLLAIGEFSRMTHLSVKTLRHYHEVGLLKPAQIDPESGHRHYRPGQVPTAQVIRRLRGLGMPVERVRSVIEAPDPESRNALIVEHLRDMERQLEQTQATVASLRALLDHHPTPLEVEYRATESAPALAVSGAPAMADAADWCSDAFDTLHAVITATGTRRAGPDGALYSSAFFQTDQGEVIAFIPVHDLAHPVPGRAYPFELAGAEWAVAQHRGPFDDLDQTYGALGRFVAGRAIGVDGPIRENYLVTAEDTDDETQHRTEVCWPVFHTDHRSPK